MGKDAKPIKGSNREIFNNIKSETYKQRVKVNIHNLKERGESIRTNRRKKFYKIERQIRIIK